MRAFEFLIDTKPSPRKSPITLRQIHQWKIEAKHDKELERERKLLMTLMYGSQSDENQFQNEKDKLELAQMRAELANSLSDSENKLPRQLSKNAKSGIQSQNDTRSQIQKLAKQGLGRQKKK